MPRVTGLSRSIVILYLVIFILSQSSLSKFKGVNRRFTQVAELSGIKIIDDYGHHPVEISAVLSAARQTATGKVFAIHQPHRYTRLNSLFEDFSDSSA